MSDTNWYKEIIVKLWYWTTEQMLMLGFGRLWMSNWVNNYTPGVIKDGFPKPQWVKCKNCGHTYNKAYGLPCSMCMGVEGNNNK